MAIGWGERRTPAARRNAVRSDGDAASARHAPSVRIAVRSVYCRTAGEVTACGNSVGTGNHASPRNHAVRIDISFRPLDGRAARDPASGGGSSRSGGHAAGAAVPWTTSVPAGPS